MAQFNQFMGIGRLTRDPEARAFANGGKVAKFGFAMTDRKKNASTGEWEETPIYIDCEGFNNGNRTLADFIEKFCRKGSQILIQGKLKLDTWQDKNSGDKRQSHKIYIEEIQLLDKKDAAEPASDNAGDAAQSADKPATKARKSKAKAPDITEAEKAAFVPESSDQEIPF